MHGHMDIKSLDILTTMSRFW